MSEPLTGRCLCGACSFTAAPTGNAGACHCEMCRRWTGGIYLSVACEDVALNESASFGSYKGSPWGERVFCRDCGSSLMWKTQDGSHHHVSIQAFDDPAQFTLGMQVFYDKKPANYALANETKTMTEAEVFAMFAPKEEPTT